MGSFGPEDIKYLHSAIQTLPKIQHKAIVYRYWHCLTITEIASKLRVSWDTADKLINDTQKILKEKITELKNSKRGVHIGAI